MLCIRVDKHPGFGRISINMNSITAAKIIYCTLFFHNSFLVCAAQLPAECASLGEKDHSTFQYPTNGWSRTCENVTFHDLNITSDITTLYVREVPTTTWRPFEFSPYPYLTTLHLEGNSIAQLPDEFFHNASSLKELDVSQNCLRSLHMDMFIDLVDLEILDLSQNHLQELPQLIFASLIHIRCLWLYYNNISHIRSYTFNGLVY